MKDCRVLFASTKLNDIRYYLMRDLSNQEKIKKVCFLLNIDVNDIKANNLTSILRQIYEVIEDNLTNGKPYENALKVFKILGYELENHVDVSEKSFLNENEKPPEIEDTEKQFVEKLRNHMNDFSLVLNKIISYKNSKYYYLTKHLPVLFRFSCKILNDSMADWNIKIMINSAVSYLVLPDDVIEDSEEKGYVDDLFIICHVLKEINNISPGLLERNWTEDNNVNDFLEELYDESFELIKDQHIDILKRVGLYKYQSLELEDYSGSYQHKLGKLAKEKRELLGLCAYLARQMYNAKSVNTRKINVLKKFIEQHGDSEEINRIIEIANKGHEYILEKKEVENNNSKLERDLEASRRKLMLGD